MRVQVACLGAFLVSIRVFAQAGIQPNTNGRNDRAFAAITRSGKTYIGGREVPVNLAFPSGKAGNGKLCVFYEPSSGFFIHYLDWSPSPSRTSCLDVAASGSRLVLGSDRLAMVWVGGNRITIIESSEKAANLDDAESKSIGWHGPRLGGVEKRSVDIPGTVSRIPLLYKDLPKGFVEQLDSRPAPPLRPADVIQKDDTHWDLVIENFVNHKKATAEIIRQKPFATPSWWVHGPFRSN